MGIFGKLFSGGDDGHYLALDIGTEVVKVLVFRIDLESGKAVVVGTSRVRQKLGNMESGAVADISGVIETSRMAIAEAVEAAGIKQVKKSIIGIAGELVKGTTTTVHYNRVNRDLKIAVPELRTIVQKVQEKAFERIQKELAWETGQTEIGIQLINAMIVDVRIDGYRVKNPINFQGGDVSMSVFNAYAPTIHLGALRTIADELGLDLLNIAAEPYAVARSVEVDDVLDFSAIFIDIGGGTTDIAVVRHGGLEGTKMFALGGRAFTKRLSGELGVSFDEAEQIKLDYAWGKFAQADTDRLTEFFAEDCRVWLSGVELSLSEFSANDLLPTKIFLCGGGSGLPGIKAALQSAEWIAHLPFAKPPQVGFLQPKDIERVTDMTGTLINPQDVTPMGLANLVLQLTTEEKLIASILRRTVEDIQQE